MVGRSSWKSAYMPRYMGWFLLSHGFNAVFYMLTFGSSVFVLWLADLGLSKDRIGFMLSLFPYCGLIAPFITSAVTRFGLKRTYMVFYGARKFVILLMLAAPWILQRFGAAVLFAYVAGVIFVFAMCRAIAETAYYPWSREFVPDAVRGRVAGMSNVVVSLTSAVAMLLASAVLARGQGYGRYQFLIVIASTLGVISVVAMLAVPKESPGSEGSSREAWTSMRQALRDRRFRGFLLSIAASVLAVAGYPFIPLFARERLLLAEYIAEHGEEACPMICARIGDLAIASGPGQMFCEFGLDCKARSPFAKTVYVSLANGNAGYVPTPIAIATGGYEPTLCRGSKLAPEAGGQMVDAQVRLLEALR